MKKTLSLLLALIVIVCSLATVSCGETAPEVLLSRAIEKVNKLEKFECAMTVTATTKLGESEFSVPVTYKFAVVDANSDKCKMSGQMEMGLFEEETMTIDIYQENKMMYVSMDGEGRKISADNEEMESYDFLKSKDQLFLDVTKKDSEKMINSVKAVKNDDGSTTVDIVVNGDEFAKAFSEVVESYADGAEDFTISNVSISATVKDGYVTKYSMKYDMSVASGDDFSTDMSVKADLEFKNFNGDVTVTPPAGYENFETYDPSMDD